MHFFNRIRRGLNWCTAASLRHMHFFNRIRRGQNWCTAASLRHMQIFNHIVDVGKFDGGGGVEAANVMSCWKSRAKREKLNNFLPHFEISN